MRSWFKRFLEKLAKANEDSFQGKKLDCCDLNQKQLHSKKSEKK